MTVTQRGGHPVEKIKRGATVSVQGEQSQEGRGHPSCGSTLAGREARRAGVTGQEQPAPTLQAGGPTSLPLVVL